MSDFIKLEHFKEVVEGNTLVVFDTSSLLHLFECAPNLTNKLLNNLWKIEDKVWIPNQVYTEYTRKKDSIKNRELNKYKNVSKSYQQQLDKLDSEYGKLTLRYKKYDFNGIEELDDALKESINELKSKISEYQTRRNEDAEENRLLISGQDIEKFVKHIIDSERIGKDFTLSELLDIYKEGEVRFEYQIPPGYEDIEKDKKDPSKRKKYGDLIIWKEILKEASHENKNIILVLEDDKNDWWNINNGQIIGPRNELIKEFKEIVSEELSFIMLGTNQFNALLSRTFEDIKDAIESFVETECEEILMNSILDEGWDTVIDLYQTVVSSFIHSGDLQPYVEHAITDVEMEGFNEPEIEEINVEFYEEYFEIEARFISEIEVSIYSRAGSDFIQQDEGTVTIKGKINAKYDVEYGQYTEEFKLKEISVESITVQDTTIHYSNLEIEGDLSDYGLCQDCKKPGDYMHVDGYLLCNNCLKHYMPCPGCGMVFDELVGAYCESCESKAK